ncbi:hypothetical protein 10S11_78 [uncultured Caudovirales phage]|uniref:Uncharacterized protein n=1 Tax=uncultured Caudovirales phage TaxID=2100421 RepID=A0A2H4J073_9CAUD|nr:hypothetical protein 10S11_78 [uncultured Caudovirales phage]
MVEKAVEKIKHEMNKDNNPYVQVIGNFLLKHLEVSPESAKEIVDNDKTIIKSLNEMRKAAEKKKVGNCAVLTDAEGFEIVLKYFGIKGDMKATPIATEIQMSKDKSKVSIDFDVKLEDFI